MRADNRNPESLRPFSFQTGVSAHAEGSCLVTFGRTKLLCTASVEENVPPFLRHSGKGWVTAEYGMLPRATHSRNPREAAKGKQSGRTQEIQRLIGRSLRAVVDLQLLGERQITVDCDVLDADGGTRTAAISGGYVALHLALQSLVAKHTIKKLPIRDSIAAISCGIVNGEALCDLDYNEDSSAEVDANFVMTGSGKLVEIQASGEEHVFTEQDLLRMMALAKNGTALLREKQLQAVQAA